MLKNDYETLLRRGMPEHPRLYFGRPMAFPDDNPRALARAAADWHNSDNGSFVEESDARDLVTMHALRWAWGTPKPPSRVCTKASECRNVPWIPTLEYIIEVTAHLEPRCSRS